MIYLKDLSYCVCAHSYVHVLMLASAQGGQERVSVRSSEAREASYSQQA